MYGTYPKDVYFPRTKPKRSEELMLSWKGGERARRKHFGEWQQLEQRRRNITPQWLNKLN